MQKYAEKRRSFQWKHIDVFIEEKNKSCLREFHGYFCTNGSTKSSAEAGTLAHGLLLPASIRENEAGTSQHPLSSTETDPRTSDKPHYAGFCKLMFQSPVRRMRKIDATDIILLNKTNICLLLSICWKALTTSFSKQPPDDWDSLKDVIQLFYRFLFFISHEW